MEARAVPADKPFAAPREKLELFIDRLSAPEASDGRSLAYLRPRRLLMA
jgi:hypothetical protein